VPAIWRSCSWNVWLPGMDGPSIEPPAGRAAATGVIMISGHGTIETAVRATKLGAFDFIEKPLSLEKIIVLVRNAVQQRAWRKKISCCAPSWAIAIR